MEPEPPAAIGQACIDAVDIIIRGCQNMCARAERGCYVTLSQSSQYPHGVLIFQYMVIALKRRLVDAEEQSLSRHHVQSAIKREGLHDIA